MAIREQKCVNVTFAAFEIGQIRPILRGCATAPKATGGQKRNYMYLFRIAIENERGEIGLTVLKYGAGRTEYILEIFWRAIKNDVAGRSLRPQRNQD